MGEMQHKPRFKIPFLDYFFFYVARWKEARSYPEVIALLSSRRYPSARIFYLERVLRQLELLVSSLLRLSF